ncbi:hypothetical protein X777_11186, partial [Ooceraea biroi]
HSPSRSSPKFPQPIFLPTRKFGPTMSTPDDADDMTLCRECTFESRAPLLPREVRFATSWSRSEPRAPSSLSLPSRFCISYRPLSTIAARIIIDTPTRIRSETGCARVTGAIFHRTCTRRAGHGDNDDDDDDNDNDDDNVEFPQAEKGTRGRGVYCIGRGKEGRAGGGDDGGGRRGYAEGAG